MKTTALFLLWHYFSVSDSCRILSSSSSSSFCCLRHTWEIKQSEQMHISLNELHPKLLYPLLTTGGRLTNDKPSGCLKKSNRHLLTETSIRLWGVELLATPPTSPVHLLLLPTRQLHGDAQLLVETRRHAEVSRQPRVNHCAVWERGVGRGLRRGDGGRLTEVGHVFSLSVGQWDGQGLLNCPGIGRRKDSLT